MFSRLRQSSIFNTTLASPLPPDRSALATSASGGHYSGDFGRGGQESGGGGRDFGREGFGRDFGRGGRVPTIGGRGRGQACWHYTHCNGTNHTVIIVGFFMVVLSLRMMEIS